MFYPGKWKKSNCWSEQSPKDSTVPFFFFWGGGGAPGIVEFTISRFRSEILEEKITAKSTKINIDLNLYFRENANYQKI